MERHQIGYIFLLGVPKSQGIAIGYKSPAAWGGGGFKISTYPTISQVHRSGQAFETLEEQVGVGGMVDHHGCFP